jgi:hypothetical protein
MKILLRLAIVLIALLLPVHGWAALSVVQHVMGNSGTSSNTLAVTITATGSNNLLVVVARTNSLTADVTSISDGTNNLTQATGAKAISGGGLSSMIDTWYLLASTSGATIITATWDETTTNRRMEVWEASGWTSVQFDGGNQLSDQTGAGTAYAGPSITTTGTVGFAVGGIIADMGAGTLTNPAGGNEYTAGGDTAGGNAYCALISASAAAHTPAWTGTVSNANYATTAAAFKGTTGAPLCRGAFMLLGVGGC